MVGDTGEGDESQFALVPPLLESGRDTQFMVICSDVIYLSGDPPVEDRVEIRLIGSSLEL